ncbi:hypothetical protein V6N00_10875 [Tersicoccus sp. MR15.9]|uniref:hypothetical protein n=1 Tax=Tersicoccus mangrovi TaxID=3121635 RepID=UPI002FE6686B
MVEQVRRRRYFLPDGQLTTEQFAEYGGRVFRAVRARDDDTIILWGDDDEAPGTEWSRYSFGAALRAWRRAVDAREVDAFFGHTLWACLDGYRFEVGPYYPEDDTVALRGGVPVDTAPRGAAAAFDLYNHPYLQSHEGGAYFTGEVPLEELSDFASESQDRRKRDR